MGQDLNEIGLTLVRAGVVGGGMGVGVGVGPVGWMDGGEERRGRGRSGGDEGRRGRRDGGGAGKKEWSAEMGGESTPSMGVA